MLYLPTDYQTTADGVKVPGRITATNTKAVVLKSWEITQVTRLATLPANLKHNVAATSR